MKALLRKDFLVLSTSFRRVLVIWLIFPLVAMINPSMSYFALYIGLVAGTLSTSLINLEEKENWNTFAGSLPISKKDVVTERYLFTLLMVAAATLIGAICYCSYLVRGLNEFANPTIILSNFAYSLLLPALTLPATYRFGV
ncbi:MAG: ABC-2 transporter permease, partial [Oscillospiraceae bacterium]|nr:ABC-2 transporter permease [Oscillospiraceae bacterium]